MISVYLQVPWLSAATSARFRFPECVETRTWEDIAESAPDGASIFSSGGLNYDHPDFGVWGCWKVHSCLSKVPHEDGDAMCYVYHETEKKWFPWTLKSQTQHCKSIG